MGSTNVDSWEEVCKYEIAALDKNKTWELVNLPAGCKAVKSKWVFKHKVDGCYHARLVAKGFMQIPSLDYDETFLPIVCFKYLRLLLALAALHQQKWTFLIPSYSILLHLIPLILGVRGISRNKTSFFLLMAFLPAMYVLNVEC